MTFIELMTSATRAQRSKISSFVLLDGFSYEAFRSWCKGTRNPHAYYQTVLQKHIKRVFNIELSVAELFPTSSNR